MLPISGRLILLAASIISLIWASSSKISRRLPLSILVTIQSLPFTLIVIAFIWNWESLDLVSRFGGEELPFLYRISAVWGGRSGPLLMWCTWLAMGSLILSKTSPNEQNSLRMVVGLNGILLCISMLLDPFAPSSGFSNYLNPLLQTDLMVIHPPVIFAFYTLCLIPAIISVSGLLEDRDEISLHDEILPWARAAFVVGTAGIGLGGLWAYTVLDWGGYWAWDPVETASFLPWICLVAVLHARSQASVKARKASPAVMIGVGALAIHSTLVTRANGVWSSVHSFAADGAGSESSDPYLRIISLAGEGAAGVEVITYLTIIMALGLALMGHLLKVQSRMLQKMGRISMRKQSPTLAASLLLATLIVGVLTGSTLVLVVGLSLMVLIVEGDSEEISIVWIFSGVALYLFASWSWAASLPLAVSGMAIFLVPWVLAPPDDEPESLLEPIFNASNQNRISRASPWFGAIAYLGLTWMLLTAEIDGTSLEAHEVFGAPILIILALSLTVYSWGKGNDGRVGVFAVIGTLAISLAIGAMANGLSLPGDPDRNFTESLTRGQVAGTILACLVIALPPTLIEMWKSIRTSISSSERLYPARWSIPNRRKVGSSIAHVGILILLLGHVLTTTLVDRTDPSHLVTLVRDQPVEHAGYTLTFTGVNAIDSEDSAYEYSIADGFVEFQIEIYDADGNYVESARPGILRFDTPSGEILTRSEIDRISQVQGDLMFILDVAQASRALNELMFGEIENIDRVGVTVYDLRGSHMVWVGWILLLIGGSLALSSHDSRRTPSTD